jgi:hypothetical protein
MKSKDIFQLAVRLLGLVFLYHGLQALPAAFAQIIGSFPYSYGHSDSMGVELTQPGSFGGFVMGVVMVGWPLVVSYWLLRGAPFIMRIAYPDTTTTS